LLAAVIIGGRRLSDIMVALIVWLLFIFAVGAAVGSFLNVAAARLPREKSLVWPGSRCDSCLQPIRWYDNLPLLSYLWLRGQCRTCKAKFSIEYFLMELFTGLAFVGLFYLEVVLNIHQWPDPHPFLRNYGLYPPHFWIGFAWHAILLSFLIVASACDLKGWVIPFSLTFTGSLVGLAGSFFLAWPWPWTVAEATPRLRPDVMAGVNPWMIPGGEGDPMLACGLKAGLYPWPVWGPLPDWLAPGGNWQTGIATALAGLLVGTFMLRTAGYLFQKGLQKEALGLGDADLMMMVGCFLGWQPVVAAFFIGALLGLPFSLARMALTRDHYLPFGPSLAAGSIVTMLCWRWIGPYLQPLMFWGEVMVAMAVAGATIMYLASFLMRLLRRLLDPADNA